MVDIAIKSESKIEKKEVTNITWILRHHKTRLMVELKKIVAKTRENK